MGVLKRERISISLLSYFSFIMYIVPVYYIGLIKIIPTEPKGYPYPCQDTRVILIHVTIKGISFSILRYMDFIRHFYIPLNCLIITIMFTCSLLKWTWIFIGGLLIKKCFFFLIHLYLFDWRNSNTHGGNLYAFSIHSFMTLIKKQFEQYLIREIFMNYL